MARRVGQAVSRPAVADQTNNIPPPSTLAAQIVHEHANDTSLSDPGRALAFDELLQLYIDEPIEETEPRILASLIDVVAKAGLEQLNPENIAADDPTLPQAAKAIYVIKLTIQRHPFILYHAEPDEHGSTSTGPSVLVRLLPKLIKVLGHKNLDVLRDELRDLLRTLLEVKLGDIHRDALLRLYQACVESILAELDLSGTDRNVSNLFSVTIPSSLGISQIWPESKQLVALPQGCQIQVTTLCQAFEVALEMILAICKSSTEPAYFYDGKREKLVSWALDRCSRLRRCLKLSQRLLETASTPLRHDLLYLSILESGTRCPYGAQHETLSTKQATIFLDGLADLLASCGESDPGMLQMHLARCLLYILCQVNGAVPNSGHLPFHSINRRLISQRLRPVMHRIAHDWNLLNKLSKDLQLTICLWAVAEEGGTEWPTPVLELRKSLNEVRNLPAGESLLNMEFSELLLLYDVLDTAEESRPSKRIKTGNEQISGFSADLQSRYLERITTLLLGRTTTDLTGLRLFDSERFRFLSEDEKFELFGPVGFALIACVGSCTLRASYGIDGLPEGLSCDICDRPRSLRDRVQVEGRERPFDHYRKEILATMTKLLGAIDSPGIRIAATLAIRRILNHVTDPEVLDLETSELAAWFLGSLRKRFREVRIAAARSVQIFVRNELPTTLVARNFNTIRDFLQETLKRGLLSDQETIIMVWGQVARICGDRELRSALVALVDYLGHTNSLVYELAYNQLVEIAEARDLSPFELLRPFFNPIAPAVVLDLHTRPQKAQQLAEFLGMSVNSFLVQTQVHTVPYLVLEKKTDILQRVAHARSPPSSVADLILMPRPNLGATLALLLTHATKSSEEAAADILYEAVPNFREHSDLYNLIRLEPYITAAELLLAAADAPPGGKSSYHKALQYVARIVETKNANARAKEKSLTVFFENHILGIMVFIAPTADGDSGACSVLERQRYLGAMQEMIGLAKSAVGVALPQLRASLQDALRNEQLCSTAFPVWAALVKAVDEEDLESIIDQTFSIITQNWTLFPAEIQDQAQTLIRDLIETHSALIRDRIQLIPSLAGIPALSKFEGEISRLKAQVDFAVRLEAFSQRCKDENPTVVRQALEELVLFLESEQEVMYESAVGQKPTPAIAHLMRSLLDACVRFSEDNQDIVILCSKCLGLIGCMDPYRIEDVREKRDVLVLSNFEVRDEIVDFIAVFLETVLVKSFRSAGNAKSQGFLAYVIQECLRCCRFKEVATQRIKPSDPSLDYTLKRWNQMPESIRTTVTPLFQTKYAINRSAPEKPYKKYPIFSLEITHGTWLRDLTHDLLRRGSGENVRMLFLIFSKAISSGDLSIPAFLLPFAALNVVLGGTEKEKDDLAAEFLAILNCESSGIGSIELENLKQCCENVFQVLDYMSRWLQARRKALSEMKAGALRGGRFSLDEEIDIVTQISSVEKILHSIPAHVMSRRAVECGSYARALFHWEQYIRQQKELAFETGAELDEEKLYQRLQGIYAQIDEPDSIEGISAHLHVLDPSQQVLEHRKAGRWTAAQSWYELSLAEKPDHTDTQIDLLTCLKESGQYDSLLTHVESFYRSPKTQRSKILPFAAEAAWVTGKWQRLENFLASTTRDPTTFFQDFNLGLGKAFLSLRNRDPEAFQADVAALREGVTRGFSTSSTASLQASHDLLLKLHVLYEIEAISGIAGTAQIERPSLLAYLDRRLELIGAYTSDKQYVLGIRRAAMQLSTVGFTTLDRASAWLTSARLARKANFTNTAFNAVLHAAKLGDDAAKVEHSRLLWKDGQHRKAIQNLEGAIAINAFQSQNELVPMDPTVSAATGQGQRPQNKLAARAHLLLAKWLDRAGQTKSDELIKKYHEGIHYYGKWDKGHYYLGRHYNKILEAEKQLPRVRQSTVYHSGEIAKLVVESYTRSMAYGCKYYYQTVPKVLTLWLDLGTEVFNRPARLSGIELEIANMKARTLDSMHKHLKRFIAERIPEFVWYTAFPQIITRISHPNLNVFAVLKEIIANVVARYPQQALWSLFAVVKSTDRDRAKRGDQVMAKLREIKRGRDNGKADLKTLLLQGDRLTRALLEACEVPVEARASHVSLTKNLKFNPKLAPCALVVPIEATMTASFPTADVRLPRSYKPFAHDAVTISSFQDDVLVLSSLQRPRKLTVRGSDGRAYGLLCKPKDDLRKDQRLMEFNAMINRGLQRDIEASKRRLYIKTYGVTPLNEECGTIEWVEGLKPMRDLIMRLYREKGIPINYAEIRAQLDVAAADGGKRHDVFTEQLVRAFPPVLSEWFLETFPEPEEWFKARLRYTRSCAVMSIVGHVLGLGDRHGENVLLQEDGGGVFHVDFNCLFDKGLTFEKPELVPFRLTHNMVDAMGSQGVEGPWRVAAELVMRLLRQSEDTALTILETFVHDPTADFIGVGGGHAAKRRRGRADVPETPQEVLDSVRAKLRGLLKGESVPLSVEGYVDALVKMATDPRNLCQMYIGWMAFF